MRHLSSVNAVTSIIAIAIALGGCNDRSDVWNEATVLSAEALSNQVVVLDKNAERAILLRPTTPTEVAVEHRALSRNVVATAVSPDKSKLFVLSSGDTPRVDPDDQPPRLTIFAADDTVRTIDLPSALPQMAIDPLGQWVVLYASASASSSSSLAFNPNELVFVDLQTTDESLRVTSRTIRSYGSSPNRLTFSSPLSLPKGEKRLLVAESGNDITLLDLNRLHDAQPPAEITVRFSDGTSGNVPIPSGVVIDDGDPTKNDDARIGVRFSNSSNVVSISLTSPTGASTNDFSTILNLTDVGGVASDLSFVRTDAGIRLAALVPSTSKAILVDPETSITTEVALPEPYSKLSLISNAVGAQGGDVALLSGSSSYSSNGVAFWALGKVAGQPYRSVEVLSVGGGVVDVVNVPAPRETIKLVQTSSSGFFVLDLLQRTASPIATSTYTDILVSDDGERIWAYAAGADQVSVVSLSNLHPTNLPLLHTIDRVFDVAARNGGRSAISVEVNRQGSFIAFDATAPNATTARVRTGLALEGL